MTLPKASDLLKQSWEIFKNKIKVLILIQLVPLIASVPLLILAGALGLSDKPGQAGADFTPEKFVLFMVFLFVVVVAALVQLWAQIAMIFVIDDTNPSVGFKEVFSKSRKFIFPYLGVSLLTGLIIFGGFFLLIVPGIIFAVWYSLSTYTLILEGSRGMDALRTSKSYVKGNTGQVMLRYAIITIVALVVYLVPGGIVGSMGLKVLDEIYSAAASLVITPVAVIYCYLIYRQLRDAHLPSAISIPAGQPVVSSPQNSQTM